MATLLNGGDMQPIPPKLRVEMLEPEVHGLDIEIHNIHLEHAEMLKRMDALVALRVSLVRQIDQLTSQ